MTTRSLISANTAREMSADATHKEEVNKLLNVVSEKIVKSARNGARHILIENNDWVDHVSLKYRLAESALVEVGYTVEPYEYEFTSNSGIPQTFHAIKVRW